MFDLHRISDFFLRRVDVEGETAALLGSRSSSSCSAFTLAVLASCQELQSKFDDKTYCSFLFHLLLDHLDRFFHQRSSFSIPCGGKLNSCLAHLSIFTTGSSDQKICRFWSPSLCVSLRPSLRISASDACDFTVVKDSGRHRFGNVRSVRVAKNGAKGTQKLI